MTNEPNQAGTEGKQPPQPPKPPDDLKYRGPDDDDSKFVTEGLARMPAMFHRFLALWLLFLGGASTYYTISNWPPAPTIEQLKIKVDSLSQRLRSVSSASKKTPADSALREIQTMLQRTNVDSVSTEAQSGPAKDRAFFLIALFSGILGASAHGLSSLMDFRGQRRLFRSWALWYFGLPIVGGLTSLIFFFVLRAGLLPSGSNLDATSPYGVAAIGAIVGLFTDKATTKLSEVLDSLFLAPTKKREGKIGGE